MMITFEAMNTSFLLAGLKQEDTIKIKKMIRYAEDTFSRFNPDSDISHINQLQQQWVKISPLTFTLLEDAVLAYKETLGLFNPFLGKQIQELGYDQSFEHLTPIDNSAVKYDLFHNVPLVPALENQLPSYLEFDETTCKVRLSSTVALDLGGIAKGWIAQYACTQLQLQGVKQGLIDAGGDIILWGRAPNHTLWGIGVANPWDNDNDIASLWLDDMTAIATSSINKRQWKTPQHARVHHIIDPRTKEPATSDLIQVTVLARDLVVAEEYAKCLLILGSEVGFAWLNQQRTTLAYIALRKDGSILTSNNLSWFCSELEVLPHVSSGH